ncbi:MAG: galactose-1-phosphate uridylyltransferase, partial [Chitinophagales bacterium]
MSEPIIDFKKHPHRRKNILTGEWLLVSPQRTQRPWQGKVEALSGEQRPAYEANCYLCPRNKRAGINVNPDYSTCFSFTNDFSALEIDTPERNFNVNDLLVAKS